jgi:RimJ/RimL family protein N-acetyltransferase
VIERVNQLTEATGAMLKLLPFSRQDFSRLVGWADSAEFLMQWAGPIFTHPLDKAQLEKYVQAAEGDPPSRRIFKAVATGSEEVIGHIELNNIDRRNRSAMVSRVLVDPARRGQGFGVELVRKAVELGFGELQLHRLELYVFDFNEAAIVCYRRAGFSVEGRLRESRRVGGEYWSLYVMSLLESEWRRYAH